MTSKAFCRTSELVAALSARFPDYRLNTKGHQLGAEELAELLEDSDGVILGLDRLNDSVLSRLPKLRVIAKFGVGLDNVDLDACNRRSVRVLHRPGVNAFAVAELTLCAMLALLRNVFNSSSKLADGLWDKNGGRSLRGRTVGLVGFGHVGTAVSKLLMPFECSVLCNDVLDRSAVARSLGVAQVGLEELVRRSDIVSLHCPLTLQTEGMFGADLIGRMRRGSILVNTARGSLLDLVCLEDALESGHLGGAALDVYPEEPPGLNSLLQRPNVVATPHIGGNSHEATLAMGMAALDLLSGWCTWESSTSR